MIFLVTARKTSWINFFLLSFLSFFTFRTRKRKKNIFFYSLKLDVVKITWWLFLGTSTLAESRRETKNLFFLHREYEIALHTAKANGKKSFSAAQCWQWLHIWGLSCERLEIKISRRSIKKSFLSLRIIETPIFEHIIFFFIIITSCSNAEKKNIERCRHDSMIWESHEERKSCEHKTFF